MYGNVKRDTSREHIGVGDGGQRLEESSSISVTHFSSSPTFSLRITFHNTLENILLSIHLLEKVLPEYYLDLYPSIKSFYELKSMN